MDDYDFNGDNIANVKFSIFLISHGYLTVSYRKFFVFKMHFSLPLG